MSRQPQTNPINEAHDNTRSQSGPPLTPADGTATCLPDFGEHVTRAISHLPSQQQRENMQSHHPEEVVPKHEPGLEQQSRSMPPPPLPPPIRSQPGDTSAAGLNSQWMPNLLDPNRIDVLDSMTFRLVIRQQPQAARACGFGDRDRRAIDPPPIVQMLIESNKMTEEEIRAYLCYSGYVMNCTLYDAFGTRDVSAMPVEHDRHRRKILGSLFTTPFVGYDEFGEEGCFFAFSDLSCRLSGSYRLKFTLVMIQPSMGPGHFPNLVSIVSDVFHVYIAKEFPGMVASSDLAKRLREQGCIISIKKGGERGRGRHPQSDEDEGSSGAY